MSDNDENLPEEIGRYAAKMAGMEAEVYPSALVEAKNMYFNYVPVIVIHQETGVSRDLLRKLVYGKEGWRDARNRLNKEIVDKIRQSTLKRLRKTTSINLRLITKGLSSLEKSLERDNRAPTLEETDILTSIYAKLQKAKISEELPEDGDKRRTTITPQKILQIFGKDPYVRRAALAQADIEMADEEDLNENPISDSLANPD